MLSIDFLHNSGRSSYVYQGANLAMKLYDNASMVYEVCKLVEQGFADICGYR